VLPEVMSFIKKVSENHRLVLLSNMPCDWGNHLEHKFGDLFEAFDQIYWSGCYKMIKPEKKIYEMVLSHNDGIRPEEIVYVDDELDDLEGSGGLFGKKVWVNRKNQSEKDLILDVTISEVLDLKNYI
jgi:FMN phosphatase YigB (HAD superfamily)